METINDLLEERGRSLGQETFLEHPESDSRMSYGEALALSRRLAARFSRAGVSRGDRVAWVLPDGPSAAVHFLAACRLGAVAVPLDERLQPGEYARILAQCRPAAVAAPGRMRPLLEGFGAFLDADEPPPSGEAPAQEIKGDHPAGIYYTSGSTGLPKGVVFTHASFLGAGGGFESLFEPSGVRRVWSIYPLRTNLGMTMAVTSMLQGGALILGGAQMLAKSAGGVLRRCGAGGLALVPALLPPLLEQLKGSPSALSPLRWMFAVGSVLPSLADEIERLSGVPVADAYGSSETGGITATPFRLGARPAGCVGRPFPGAEVRIVDGEIAAKTPGMMAGYYGGAPAGEWFLTGDLGALDGEGRLFIHGRKTETILASGGRAYGKDVDEALSRHPAVLECVTVARREGPVREFLVSFVVPREGARPGEEELLEHCRKFLAGYKCPSSVRLLERLPRSALGKVVKDLLPP
jgi:acyl-coenzyme A synthetase/AMP-(fatty) acid ligase